MLWDDDSMIKRGIDWITGRHIKSVHGQTIFGSGNIENDDPITIPEWGNITGDIHNQPDLMLELDRRVHKMRIFNNELQLLNDKNNVLSSITKDELKQFLNI